MRVLQVGKFYPPDPGGVETATRQMAEHLAALGMETGVLCFAGSGDYDDLGLPWPVWRAPVAATIASQPLSALYVRRLIALAPQFDVLHVHWPNPLAALAVFLARPRGKVVLHWHSDVIGKGTLARAVAPLEAWLCRRADLVIGPTPVHLAASNRAALLEPKGAVVPFCVDASMPSPGDADPADVAALRQRLGGRRIVFALGRLVPYKGLDVLLDAAVALANNVVVGIGGGGPLAGALAARVAALGLAEKVILAGHIPDAALPVWLAACDVFCLPSVTRAEMFGIVQLEAMVFGRPVVATAIPGSGVPWVNRHGATGLVVPPGDARELAAALTAVLDDPVLANRLGQGGKAAVAGPFSPRGVRQALAAAYGRLE